MDARRRGLALVLGLWAAAAPGCRREPATAAPPFVVDGRDKKAPDLRATEEPAAPEPAVVPAAASADGTAEYATVEISGALEFPPGVQPKDKLMVFIGSGDCLNDSAPLLRRLPVTDNRTFFAAVMVPPGSTLSVCAAAEPAPGLPCHLYGHAGVRLQKTADQTIRDLKITLAEDTPRRFATKISR